jgi:hypothetical protein
LKIKEKAMDRFAKLKQSISIHNDRRMKTGWLSGEKLPNWYKNK